MKKFIQSHPIEILFSILFLTLAAILNLQFLDGANINQSITGHDEYLTVQEVYSILSPLSWKHFILAIIGGDIMYYGRVVFYTDALFAYIPYKIWGLEGMVYAIRMTHSIWILVGLLILNTTFLKEKLYKFFFLFGSFGLYYTLYFIQMPKPEPLQLVFLALFLRGFIKREYQFGLSFIWLGLAFATKVNVLVVLPLLFAIPIVQNLKKVLKPLMKQIAKGLAWFLTGFFVGIPCLLLSPIMPIYLKTYLSKTIFGSEKSYDDASLTAIDWIRSGLGGSYLGNNWLGFVFLFVILGLFTLLILRYVQVKKINSNLLLIGIGLVFTLFIAFITKRLWPHYLWTAYIFLWLGLLIFAHSEIKKVLKMGAFGFILLFFSTSAFSFYSTTLPNYIITESKTQKEINISKGLYAYIESEYKNKKIGLDGTVWYPYKYFVAAKPYHPFSSQRPKICNTCITWHPDQPMEIWENEIVVFNQRFPPYYLTEEETNNTPVNWEEILKEFNIQTQTYFQLDTVIGSNRVYKRK
jgi:hypothetical protein